MSWPTDPMQIDGTVSCQVSRWRVKCGWSQSELARRMVAGGWDNYSQMTVSRTEKGERRVSAGELVSLGVVFGVEIDELLRSPEGEPPRQPQPRVGGQAMNRNDFQHEVLERLTRIAMDVRAIREATAPANPAARVSRWGGVSRRECPCGSILLGDDIDQAVRDHNAHCEVSA